MQAMTRVAVMPQKTIQDMNEQRVCSTRHEMAQTVPYQALQPQTIDSKLSGS